MILTINNLYWEDRNSGLYLCLESGDVYRDIRVMDIELISLKTYIRWMITGILNLREAKVVYSQPKIAERLYSRDKDWVIKKFIKYYK